MAYPQKRMWNGIFCLSLLILLVIMLVSITLGPAGISFREALNLVLAKMPVGKDYIQADQYPLTHQVIVYKVRMPRVILAALVGSSLAAVGTTFQGLFKNPMADPYVIGVSAGAALGAAIAIVADLSMVLGIWALPAAAFLGAFLATLVVYHLARIGKKVPVYTLLLAGVALSALMNALMSFLMIMNAKELHQIVYWTLGSFAGKNWDHVKIAAPTIILGIMGLWLFAKELNAMLFGEETAKHLGIEIESVKKILLFLAAVTVGAAVAVSGTIGFVGLIIPHIARLLFGPDHRILLPTAALIGASFMVATDTFARVALAPTEIPVGIITAFFGGPFFIYLLKRKKTGII